MRDLMNPKNLFRTALILMLLLFPVGKVISASQVATLTEINIAPVGSYLTIDLNSSVNTKIFTLQNPERWVIDISPAKWSKDIPNRMDVKSNDYFSLIRTGQWQENTARFVVHTSGQFPVVEMKDNQIFILFDKSDLSHDTIYTGIQPLPIPEPKESFLKSDENMVNQAEPEKSSSGNLEELKYVREPVKFSGRKGQVEEMGISVRENKTDTIKLSDKKNFLDKSDNQLLPYTDSKEIKTSDFKTQNLYDVPFEIMTDGRETLIKIDLGNQRSYDVKRVAFPDRLIIEYPSRAHSSESKALQYNQVSRERIPIGIIQEYSKFDSENPSGFTRLAFYAKNDFEYETLLENHELNVTIFSTGESSDPKFAAKIKYEPESSDIETTAGENNYQASPVVQIPQEDKSDSRLQTKDQPLDFQIVDKITDGDSTKISQFSDEKESIEGKPVLEAKSFRIDNSDTEDLSLYPQIGTSFILKEVETESAIQASAKSIMNFLPDYSKQVSGESERSLTKSDLNIASGPLMFDPPVSTPALPKGTRPAADMFLTKGESVIVPTKNLVRASVGDPEVISVNVLTQEEILITAKGEGQTTLILWEDGIGRSVRWINVGRNTLLKTIDVERVISNPAIAVNFIGESTIVLEGKVSTEEEIIRAVKIAEGAVEKVVNLIEMTNPKQVLVKVRFVEIHSKDKDEFLNQFGSGTRTEAGDFQFNLLTDIMNPELASGGIFDISLHPSVVKGNSGDQRFDPLDLMFSWLEQNRKGKVLSQPNIVTLSNHEAHFRVGGEIPYTYQNQEGFNVVDFREFGVELTVIPLVDSQNNINMKVHPVVRMPDFALAISGIPGFKTREVLTSIQVADNQTIVIGGLLQQEEINTKSKVPLFGDMPLIGKLFTSKSKSYEETELLIFLTPMVLKDILSVEQSIRNDDDLSLSPYYQQEFVGAHE